MAAIGGPRYAAGERRLTWAEMTLAGRLSRMAFTAAFDRGAGMEAFKSFNRRANAAARKAAR